VAVQVLFAGLGPEAKQQDRCHQGCGEQALHGVKTGIAPTLGTPSSLDAWGSAALVLISLPFAGTAAACLPPIHSKCSSCRYFDARSLGGLGYCRLWSTVLSADWSLPNQCPSWSARPAKPPV